MLLFKTDRTTGAERELLVITSDTRFFASLQYAAAPNGWEIRWARSLNGAMAILAGRALPVILYDWCSVAEDWTASIGRLNLVPEEPCIILAADGVDEDLWRRALGLRVHDVVCRTGGRDHLFATLQFAWKWKATSVINRSESFTAATSFPPLHLVDDEGRRRYYK